MVNEVHDARLTTHARQRLAEMNVPEDEVRSVLRYPIETRSGHRSYTQTTYYVGRRICVVVGDIDVVIVTVLWTDTETAQHLQPERLRKGTTR